MIRFKLIVGRKSFQLNYVCALRITFDFSYVCVCVSVSVYVCARIRVCIFLCTYTVCIYTSIRTFVYACAHELCTYVFTSASFLTLQCYIIQIVASPRQLLSNEWMNGPHYILSLALITSLPFTVGYGRLQRRNYIKMVGSFCQFPSSKSPQKTLQQETILSKLSHIKTTWNHLVPDANFFPQSHGYITSFGSVLLCDNLEKCLLLYCLFGGFPRRELTVAPHQIDVVSSL